MLDSEYWQLAFQYVYFYWHLMFSLEANDPVRIEFLLIFWDYITDLTYCCLFLHDVCWNVSVCSLNILLQAASQGNVGVCILFCQSRVLDVLKYLPFLTSLNVQNSSGCWRALIYYIFIPNFPYAVAQLRVVTGHPFASICLIFIHLASHYTYISSYCMQWYE